MIESHEEKLCRLFDQAIYIYLISCRVESSFRIELSSQASQLNSSAQIQLLNSIQHFFKKISIRLDTFRVEYSTRRDQSTCNQKNHYFTDYKDEKIKNRSKESDVNQIFIDSILHMNHLKISKKGKLLINTSNHQGKNKKLSS